MSINPKYQILYLIGVMMLIMFQQSCTHDSFIIDDTDPNLIDTTTTSIDTMVVDTMIVDTMDIGVPCDPSIIYFNRDILPILNGSCAFSDCHDAATATDGVILDSYENVINTAEVVPFDLGDSELYEVITENDPDDVMPPSGKMDNATISLIAQWILQGAKNLECDDVEECNTENISYTGYVKNIFTTSCNGCHSTSAAFGGVVLDTYTGVKTQVDGGRLYGAINWNQGFSPMPQAQDQLENCKIAKIKSWIDAGAQDN